MNKQYISNDLADKTLHLKLMNMRKSIILLAFILGGFTVANAQSVVEGTKLTDNWSVGVNAGGVTPLTHSAFFKGMRPTFGVGVSKQLTPIFGLGFQGMGYINTTSSKTAFDASDVSVLGKVNLMNLFASYTGEPRLFEVEAKKYTLSYDEYENNVNLLDKILKDKHLSEYKQITIGCWDYEGGDCSALLQGMIENKEKFAQIEGLFWGDIEQEEQEISWIEQADISPLLDAMPKLKDLKIKGTNNLRLGKTSRPELRSLEIISGGLPTEVVEDILGSDFPNLEKLILYVGVEDYGFEADIEIFRPLFSKERFPKLTYLGIVNSEEQDKIVEMFLESDILPQLETMDVSAGTLKDEGAQLLLDNMDKIAHLKFINMRYNYLSKEMKKQLQSLPMKIDIAETEEADEYDGELWYYPMITE